MDRVSSARVRVDDTVTSSAPTTFLCPAAGSSGLRLTNGDEPEFEVNGKPLATDLFPRFENPFVRGGLVEWRTALLLPGVERAVTAARLLRQSAPGSGRASADQAW